MKVSNVILFVLLLTSIEAYSQKVAFTRTIGNTTISTKVTLPKKQPNIANSQSIPQGKTFNLDYKSKEELIGKATLTTNKAIYKGQEYPVYATKKGKLFIVYPNKDPKKGFSKKTIPNIL